MDSTDKTMRAPNGDPTYTEKGVLSPGWKAAIEILRHEMKVTVGSLDPGTLTDPSSLTSEQREVFWTVRAYDQAIDLLEEQGKRMGILD